MYLAGLVSRNPAAFKTVWRDSNLLDAGGRSDTFNSEVLRSHCGWTMVNSLKWMWGPFYTVGVVVVWVWSASGRAVQSVCNVASCGVRYGERVAGPLGYAPQWRARYLAGKICMNKSVWNECGVECILCQALLIFALLVVFLLWKYMFFL